MHMERRRETARLRLPRQHATHLGHRFGGGGFFGPSAKTCTSVRAARAACRQRIQRAPQMQRTVVANTTTGASARCSSDVFWLQDGAVRGQQVAQIRLRVVVRSARAPLRPGARKVRLNRTGA